MATNYYNTGTNYDPFKTLTGSTGISSGATQTASPAPAPPSYSALAGVSQASAPRQTSSYTGNSIVDYLGSIGQASDFTTRSQLAAQQGITNYQGTAEQNLQLLNQLRGTPVKLTTPTGQTQQVIPGSQQANDLLKGGANIGTPVDTSKITTTVMSPETNINIPKPQQSTSYDADTMYGGAKTTVEQSKAELDRLQQILTPPETELSKQISDLIGETGDLGESLTGRGEAQLSEEQKRGIEQLRSSISDISTQLNTKLAEIDALTASYNEANTRVEGLNILETGIQGKKGQLYREYLARKNSLAAEAGIINSQLLGVQGKLDSAQAAADRAVDLMYADREATYNAKLNQLNTLLPFLDKEEERYGKAVQLLLEREQENLNTAKQNTRDILNIHLEAIKNGITDPNVLNRIRNANSIGEAQQILGENIPMSAAIDGGGTEGEIKYSTSQYTAAGYAQRTEEANQVISRLESQFTGITSRAPIPEFLKSEDRKLLEQAERNFINAVLRRESGAAIADSEFDSARKQYFPQPGDTATVLAQKKANRETVMSNLAREAGGAYQGTSSGYSLPPLTQSYNDLKTLTKNNPQYIQIINDILIENPNLSDREVQDEINQILSFNNVGGDTNTASNVKIPQSARLAYVNNNPGNLRYVGQRGATQGEGGFARFSSPQAGYEALKAQIELDTSRGHTLASFINKYAPPSENATNQYIDQVSSRLGVSSSTPLSKISLDRLAQEVARKESSTVIT